MTVSFSCPHCGKSYERVKKELVGKKARCSCGKLIRIGRKEPTGQDIPNVEVEIKNRLIVDDHYNDLDHLLGDGYQEAGAESVTKKPDRYPALPMLPIPSSALNPPKTTRNSTTRAAIGFLAAVISASIAFWFGFVVVSSRFVEFDQVLLKRFAEFLGAVNQADFGREETSPGLLTGFAVTGWAMWGVALMMMVMAIGQFLDAWVQLFTGRRIIGWGDGLVASLAIAFVFLIVAILFLHTSHMASLNRELNKVQAPDAFGESSLQNVERVRADYKIRSRKFITVMLLIGTIPMSVFVFSMIRLFALTGDANHFHNRKQAPMPGSARSG